VSSPEPKTFRRRSYVVQPDMARASSAGSSRNSNLASVLATDMGDLVQRIASMPVTNTEVQSVSASRDSRPGSGRNRVVQMLVDAVRTKEDAEVAAVLQQLQQAAAGGRVAGAALEVVLRALHPLGCLHSAYAVMAVSQPEARGLHGSLLLPCCLVVGF
jgi:hypothetical protein